RRRAREMQREAMREQEMRSPAKFAHGIAFETWPRVPRLPLVDMRGRGALASGKRTSPRAQTRGDAPSPGICAKSGQIPTSLRVRGEVKVKCDRPSRLSAMRRGGGRQVEFGNFRAGGAPYALMAADVFERRVERADAMRYAADIGVKRNWKH